MNILSLSTLSLVSALLLAALMGYGLGAWIGGKKALKQHQDALTQQLTREHQEQAHQYFQTHTAALTEEKHQLAQQRKKLETQQSDINQRMREVETARQKINQQVEHLQDRLKREEKRRQNAVFSVKRHKARVKTLSDQLAATTN